MYLQTASSFVAKRDMSRMPISLLQLSSFCPSLSFRDNLAEIANHILNILIREASMQPAATCHNVKLSFHISDISFTTKTPSKIPQKYKAKYHKNTKSFG